MKKKLLLPLIISSCGSSSKFLKNSEAAAKMLIAKSLKKAKVPSTLIPNPSPANLKSTRLALHVDEDDASSSSCWVYLASGCRVYKIHVSLGQSPVGLGKESLLIPEQTQVLDAAEVKRCPHRFEIQSIALSEVDGGGSFILGSVDSFGHLIVSKLDSSSNADRFTFSISPRDCGVGEGSWAGLCFNPCQWSMTGVARSFSKCIDIYDQDIHLRTMHTLWYPTSVAFMHNTLGGSEGSVLAVTEGCQLSIWDLRVKENGGCVHRTCGSVGDILYSVCNSASGNIAVGGADRTVTVYDPRRWCALSRWLNCSKYEITGLPFSSLNPDYIYVQGVDYEVSCGLWTKNSKAFSFRGDSNWLGFSKHPSKDVLGGWCDSGNIFIADVTTMG